MNNTKIVLVGGIADARAALREALLNHNDNVIVTTSDEVTELADYETLNSLYRHQLECLDVLEGCSDWGEEQSQLPHNKPYLANNKRDIYRSRGKVGKRR